MASAEEPEVEESQSNELNDLGHRIIALATEKTAGISNDEIIQSLPNTTTENRVSAINKLLQQGIIEILTKGTTLIYRLKDTAKKSGPLSGADNEEKVVYSIIEEGGNKGIWIRDIRVKSNLIMTQLNKILKNLENKKLIKAVKSVNASKKKVYMLYNQQPDSSVTGGAWYQDQDFEAEFVDVLNQQCLRFLQMRKDAAKVQKVGPLVCKEMSSCSVKDVHKFISELGISKVNLDEDDLETILKTVVYDGKAERIVQHNGKCLYRAIDSPIVIGIVQIPCGICPVIKHCSTCGEITPKSCQYMNEWLD